MLLALTLTTAIAASGGTAGGPVLPVITQNNEPIVGQTLEFTMENTVYVPGAEGYIVGFAQQIPPIPLGGNGFLEIDATLPLFFFAGDASQTTTFPIPSQEDYIGATLYWQGYGLVVEGQVGTVKLSNLVSTRLESPVPENLAFETNPVTYLEDQPIAPNELFFDWYVESLDIDPLLPAGLTLERANDGFSAELVGTPTEPGLETTYTVTAINENGSDEIELVMTIDPEAPTSFQYTTNPAVYVAGTRIAPNVPIVDTFVDTFSVDPALPAGLVLDPVTGVVSGTAEASSPQANYTVTASNVTGSIPTTLNLKVNPAAPSGLTYSHPYAVYAVGNPIPSNVPTVTAEVIDSFSVSPALPNGLTLNTGTGVITGTPTTVSNPQQLGSYEVTATNQTGSDDFTIEIVVDSLPSPTLAAPAEIGPGDDIEYTLSGVLGGVITEVLRIDVQTQSPPVFVPGLGLEYLDSGSPTYMTIPGDGSLTWSFPVPNDTGLVGTVYSAQATGFVVQIPNAGTRLSSLVQTEVTLPEPMNLAYPQADLTLFVGEAMDPQTPTIDGFVETWSIDPALPPGLTFDTEDGTISGTPTAAQSTVAHTVTAESPVGEDTDVVSIRVLDGSFPQFAFAANQLDNTVSAFGVNDETGQLRHLGFAQTGTGPVAVAASSDSRFVYTVNAFASTVTSFRLDTSTGALSQVGNIGSGAIPFGIVVEETDSYAYVACTGAGGGGDDGVFSYTINPTIGNLTPLTANIGPGTRPNDIAIHGDVIVTCSANGVNTIESYLVDPGTGALTPISSLATGASPRGVEFSPDGDFVYTANQAGDSVSGYSVSVGGVLTELSLSPYDVLASGGDQPEDVCTTRDGFLYTANLNGTVTGFSIGGDGNLTSLGSIPAAASYRAVTPTPDGGHLFAVSDTDNEIDVFDVGPAGGLSAATPIPTVRGRLSPGALVVTEGLFPLTYSSANAYVVAEGENQVYEYSLNPATGGLAQNGTANPAGGLPRGVSVHPTQTNAFVTNFNSANVTAYTIQPAGTLGNLPPAVTLDPNPWSLSWEPSGRYGYVFLGSPGGGVQRVDKLPAAGSVTAGPVFGAGAQTRRGTVDPTGRFVYAPNQGPDNVSQFLIDAGTGGLIPGTPGSVGASLDPLEVDVHPSGRFAYVASDGTGVIDVYAVDSTLGLLTSTSSVSLGGAMVSSMAIVPSGRYLYASLETSDAIAIFSIDASTGALTEDVGAGSPVGTDDGPVYLTTDAAGKFLYVVHRGASDIIRPFEIDRLTGALDDGLGVGVGTNPWEMAIDRVLDTTSE